jgi:MFS family permease
MDDSRFSILHPRSSVAMKIDTVGGDYLQRLRRLSRPARLYLLHAALLTSSLAISGLLFNLAIGTLGYPRTFLGLLNTVSIGTAALLSLPLWWLAARIGLWWGLLAAALLNAASALIFALWPATLPLLVASALTGVAAVLFQVSSPPFMMRHSDAQSRDHLFSANTAINVGLAGVGSLVGGALPALFGRLLGVGAESVAAYRATFLVTAGGLLLSLAPLLLIAGRRAQQGAATVGSQPTNDQRPTTNDQRPTAERQGDKETRRQGDTQPTNDERRTTNDAYRLAPGAYGLAPATDNGPRATGYVRAKIQRLTSRLPGFWQEIVVRPGPLLRLLISPLLISLGAALLIPYLNLFFKQRFDIPDSTLGVVFAALGMAVGAAALVGPAISTRIGKIRTVVLTQALSIPFLLLLGFVPLFPVAVVAALARAALFNMASPLYDAFAMERTDEDARPTVIGLINGAYSVGYLIAPTISTRVQENYGFAPLFVATALCYVLAVLANYWSFVRRRVYQASPSPGSRTENPEPRTAEPQSRG